MRRTLLFVFLLIACLGPLGAGKLSAQPDYRAPRRYSFIRYEQNQLHYTDTASLHYFFRHFDRAARGDTGLHILHIGDSHIQADIFPYKLRSMMHADSALAPGNRGFVFPFSLAKTNNPPDYKIRYRGHWEGCRSVSKRRQCPWGLAGITATTYSPAAQFSLSLSYTSKKRYPFDRIRIYYQGYNKRCFRPKVLEDSLVQVDSVHQDSLNRYREFFLKAPVSSVKVGLDKVAPLQNHFTIQGMELGNTQRQGITYSSTGVNGAEVTSFLKSPALEGHLKILDPDMVVVSLGANDSYYKTFAKQDFKMYYNLLLQRIIAACPNVQLVLTTPGDSYRYRRSPNPENREARNAVFEIADELDLVVWDFYNIMGGYKSINSWRANGLAQRDRLHLTNKGYKHQAELFYSALMKGYDRYLNAKPEKKKLSPWQPNRPNLR